jgi:hypothetical protein
VSAPAQVLRRVATATDVQGCDSAQFQEDPRFRSRRRFDQHRGRLLVVQDIAVLVLQLRQEQAAQTEHAERIAPGV